MSTGCRLQRNKSQKRLRPWLLPTVARERRRCELGLRDCAIPLCKYGALSHSVLQKWSKGKQKEKANNMVLFDQVSCLLTNARCVHLPGDQLPTSSLPRYRPSQRSSLRPVSELVYGHFQLKSTFCRPHTINLRQRCRSTK